MADLAAILIVNGGQDPPAGKWLKVCLEQIRRHTEWPNLRFYVWNNNLNDPWVADWVGQFPKATLLSAEPGAVLAHRHAEPLQRLYERALEDQPAYILTLDSDAFPIRSGWLGRLIGALEGGAALAGVWRDELEAGISPYIHPSCLATRTTFIEEHSLRLDQIADRQGQRSDTLAHFTEYARASGGRLHPLKRSNHNQLHRLIGGIYGGLIYHHGAGSRPGALFWDDPQSLQLNRQNVRIRELAAALVFEHTDRYIDWLQGVAAPSPGALILGMHRSGTSCLAGSLERCGLYLGEVNRSNLSNPKGKPESRPIARLNESILEANGGKWDAPPETLEVGTEHQQLLTAAAQAFTSKSFWGLKDPRLLLTLSVWREILPEPVFVGTFRHPAAVARSLAARNQMTAPQALELWGIYNQKLVDLHRQRPFPLIEFDLSDAGRYCLQVAALAAAWGLRPEIARIRSFVSRRLDRMRASEGEKLPPGCRELYSYMKEHAYQPSFPPGSFEAQLLDWGSLADTPVEISLQDQLTFQALRVFRRLPRPVKRWSRKIKRGLEG